MGRYSKSIKMLHELEKEEEERCKKTRESPKQFSLHLIRGRHKNNGANNGATHP